MDVPKIYKRFRGLDKDKKRHEILSGGNGHNDADDNSDGLNC